MKPLKLACLLGLLAMTGCATLPPVRPVPARFDFVVIGDTPYDSVDEALLSRAVPAIKALNPPFVLHVGDTQSGGEACGALPDARLAKLLSDLKPLPVFYAVGDNEWTDCDRKIDPATGKPFSELARLGKLRSQFFSAPAVAGRSWHYVQQRGMPENARFDFGGMTFVTLNVVGTNNGRDSVVGDDLKTVGRAADARDAANKAWLDEAFDHAERVRAQGVVVVMQADMTTNTKPEAQNIACIDAVADRERLCDGFLAIRRALIDRTHVFGKPVFYIHGDTDPFTLRRGLEGKDSENLWELNAAGDAGVTDDGLAYGVRDVTHVWIDLSQPEMLRAEGLMTGQKPSEMATAP